ncbi:hypothetical protein [Flavobacterium anhuiense]|uniref:hypothetical protein n=1 Tax=Flavobacterium anhuiense TaxID=459526 RepID=UPI0034D96C6A
MTINKINQPYKNYFKNKINEIKKEYRDFPKISNQIVDDETFFYKRRMKLRNKIIDSLNILANNKIVIIDDFTDINGEQIESTYFIYNNVLLLLNYKKDEKQGQIYYKPVVIKTVLGKLEEYNADEIRTVYDYFNKSDFNGINGGIEFKKFVSLNITVIINKRVGFYLIRSNKQGSTVTKLE